MNLASIIDHTLLRANTSEKEISKICDEAKDKLKKSYQETHAANWFLCLSAFRFAAASLRTGGSDQRAPGRAMRAESGCAASVQGQRWAASGLGSDGGGLSLPRSSASFSRFCLIRKSTAAYSSRSRSDRSSSGSSGGSSFMACYLRSARPEVPRYGSANKAYVDDRCWGGRYVCAAQLCEARACAF